MYPNERFQCLLNYHYEKDTLTDQSPDDPVLLYNIVVCHLLVFLYFNPLINSIVHRHTIISIDTKINIQENDKEFMLSDEFQPLLTDLSLCTDNTTSDIALLLWILNSFNLNSN